MDFSYMCNEDMLHVRVFSCCYVIFYSSECVLFIFFIKKGLVKIVFFYVT